MDLKRHRSGQRTQDAHQARCRRFDPIRSIDRRSDLAAGVPKPPDFEVLDHAFGGGGSIAGAQEVHGKRFDSRQSTHLKGSHDN
jgi:hypothetical protein